MTAVPSEQARIEAAVRAYIADDIWESAPAHQHIWREGMVRALAAADAVDELRQRRDDILSILVRYTEGNTSSDADADAALSRLWTMFENGADR